jgi:hypothetical protein
MDNLKRVRRAPFDQLRGHLSLLSLMRSARSDSEDRS